MTREAAGPEPRRFEGTSWIVLGAWMAYLVWAVWSVPTDRWHAEWDGATYLLTARSLAEGEGYVYLGEPFTLRPPGLAWLLSFTFPGPEYDWATVNLVFDLFGAFAVGALYLCLRRRLGRGLAIATALAAGLSPLWGLNFNSVLSELPFLLALFLAVLWLERSSDRERLWWLWALLGALSLTAAFYLRSVAILMLPALPFLGWRHDRGVHRLRALLAPAVFVVLIAPWMVHSRQANAEAEVPREQLLLHDYATAMFHQSPGDPSSPRIETDAWIQRLTDNGHELLTDLGQVLFQVRAIGIGVLAALLVVAGLLLRVRRGPGLLEWLFVVYLALILTYFTYHPRLILPLVPLALAFIATLLQMIGTLLAKRWRPARQALPAAGMGLILLGSLLQLPETLDAASLPGEVDGTMGETWDDIEKMGAWLREHTPEDAVILCNRAPILSVAANRRCYTYRFLRDATFLERYGIDWVVFDAYAPPNLRKFIRERSKDRTILESAVGGAKIVIFEMR